MMRSGKRGDLLPRQEEQIEEEITGNTHWEKQNDFNEERLKSVKIAGQQNLGLEFLRSRSLRTRAGLARRGRRRYSFGRAHMMRSGKRGSWGPCEPSEVDDLENADYEKFR